MGARRWIVMTLVGVVVAVGLSACGGGGSSVKADLTATKLLRFNPDHLSVRLNHQVTWTFHNDDKDHQHNFTLSYVFTDATQTQNVSVDVGPGQTKDITFTVTEKPTAGFLTFYCRFHQSDGMNGKITVT
jgi:plastocyanin